MVFRKARRGAPPGFFACEAAGLRWLAVRGGPRVARVLAVHDDALELEEVRETGPTPAAARAFGAALARMHDAGAPAFGAPPDGWSGDGFFGPLDQPLPLRAGAYDAWGRFYAECRLAQVAANLRARGRLDADLADGLARVSEALTAGAWDDDERPARLHGDLWSGNVLWSADGAVLIDPAAHGGHRMTDLAMLELFGAPFLDQVRAGYHEVHPLPGDDVRAELVAVHQLYPLGMHAVLFGGGYVGGFARLVARVAALA
jgi:fructosamine-3-kinase